MAAKQSKLWAYIIAFLLLAITAGVVAFFLYIKPGYTDKIKDLTGRLTYAQAVNDSIMAAKQHTDTVIVETLISDTVTITEHTIEYVDEVGVMPTIYKSTFKTQYFTLPYEIRAWKLERITFYPYTIKELRIKESTIVNYPEYPDVKAEPRNSLWLNMQAGLNGLLGGGSLSFNHKSGWGAGLGITFTKEQHFYTLSIHKKLY